MSGERPLGTECFNVVLAKDAMVNVSLFSDLELYEYSQMLTDLESPKSISREVLLN